MENFTFAYPDWATPLLVVVSLTGLAYWLLGKTFTSQPQNHLYRQLAFVGLFVFSQIALVIALPLGKETQEQLLTLFGYALTAVIALSSTSFVSNAMAGLMLKATGTFHTGDFIRVDTHFGRVTAKALLHTDIQSEDRDKVTLPNLFLITNPVKVVDQSGTLIGAEVSIGYDVHRRVVRDQLLEAAAQTDLKNAFVLITEIGDFSVTYKIAGLLEDVTNLVSKRSELKAKVIDALHQAKVEIMTPTIMDQRLIEPNVPVIPLQQQSLEQEDDNGKAERIMFDKAELAARVERFREHRDNLKEEIKTLQEHSEPNLAEIDWRQHQVSALEDLITKFDQQDG